MINSDIVGGVALQTDDCVRDRYSAASQQQEPALCCPVIYDLRYLQVIPQEIIDRDYGCGDPTPYVRPGDTVVDLGSGGGKLSYIISQQIGAKGRVIGVDVNADMLSLARSHQASVSRKIGYDNVEFRRGRIQDLAIDLEQLANELTSVSLDGSSEGALSLVRLQEDIRARRPMIADGSVDCIVSNCVLNLVKPSDRRQLFREMFRVLKPGGRAAISDIVSNEDVPTDMQHNATLWSGCISGAWREDRFIDEFVTVGFEGARIVKRQDEPWKTVNGIEFRSVTILAFKPFLDEGLDRNQAVIYRGPFRQVLDDEGHVYERGQRTAVSGKTFQILSEQSYSDSFYLVEPDQPVTSGSAGKLDGSLDPSRDLRQTNGLEYNLTQLGSNDCCGGSDTKCC